MKMIRSLWWVSLAGVLAVAPAATLRAQFAHELIQFEAELLAPNAASSDFFGTAVAVRGDLAVVGASEAAPAGTASGAAYVFARQDGQWTWQQMLQPVDPTSGLRFGSTVAINEAGDTILVAGRGSGRGTVYLFVQDGTQWVQQGRLKEEIDYYGSTADISGDTVVVGAPFENAAQPASGAAYFYVRDGANWAFQQKIKANDPGIDDNFGWSVALHGNTALIGAPFDNLGGNDAGSAYVFTRSGTTWSQQQQLTAPDPAARDWFGLAVDVNGDWAVIGSPNDDDGGEDTGSAYVFERTGAAWASRGKLHAGDRAARDGLGRAIALNETADALVLGVAAKDGNRGAAYLYTRGLSTWTEQRKLTASRPATGDSFGTSVALSGETILSGATGADTAVNNGGSAHVFARSFVDPDAVAAWARNYLYFPDAAAEPRFDPNQAAFRYQQLLYGVENDQIRARFETMASLYGPDERARAALAEEQVLAGLSRHPSNAVLGNLWLDIFYDRTVAESILGRTLLTQAEAARFGPPIAPPARPNGFVIDNEISLYRQWLATNRVVLQGYFTVLQTELEVRIPAVDLTRWATQVLGFSSEYAPSSPTWNAIQALGEPDTYPNYGDVGRAWASQSRDDQREFIELGYENPAPIHSISIYETFNPGAVDNVSVRDPATAHWVEVWSGTAAPAPPRARIFTVTFPLTAFPVDAVRVELDSPAVPGWNEIDAVSVTTPDLPVAFTESDFGSRVFQTLVPGRALLVATYTDTNGVSMPVTTDAILFSGYKDLTLLFGLLRDHGRSAETLARLLLSRDGAGDRAEAEVLVRDALRFLFLQGTLLKNRFPHLPPEGDPSGLAEAIAGWSQGLRALGTVEQLLLGGGNALGFADDFMMYVQKFSGQTELFDSYDAFRERLDPNTGSNPLRSALQALEAARDSYANYRGFQDQLAAQFDNSSITYLDRLRDIVGVFPDHPAYSDDPTANPGSELDQQYRSIELARLRILRNQTEIDNLDQEIQIEINRAAAVAEVVLYYGDARAEVTKQIGHIKAAQAAASALADALSLENLTKGLFFGFLVNAAVQAGAEEGIAHLEAHKERLAAAEQAELDGIESQARVKTLLLGMRTLAVDSQEARVLLQQELNRLVALYREKEDLEQKIAEQDASVAARYFADPVHRLASQADMVTANLAFEEARKWLYFMARALEYKWNTPFRNYAFGGRTWSTDTIFQLRNATELEMLYQAMDSFENQIQLPKDDYFDWFSVRDDFFGYRRTNTLGQALFYTDPVTGATVDALTAFRSRLSQWQDAQGNIQLNFSTVTEIPGGTFFRGPRFNAQGQVISKGLFLDKIRWLKISLPGNHTLGRTQLTGELRYGGTGFIRNFDVGTFDRVRPDRLRDELTAYATRFWFFHAPSTTWRFTEALSSPVTMQLSFDPRVPPSVQELDVFRERSVATTGWTLTLPTRDAGQPVLNIGELDDVEIYFFHYAVTRP